MTSSDIVLTSSQPADRNPALVYLASLPSKTGSRTQAQALRVVADILDTDFRKINWAALRYQHTAFIRSQLIERYAPATANKILSALRGTLKNAWRLGLMPAEDYQRAIMLDHVTGETLPAGRELIGKEISALIKTCLSDKETPRAGARDAALIALMYTTGLRRHEVAGLQLANCDFEKGEIVVRGKRYKERKVWLVNEAKQVTKNWIAIRGTAGNFIFVPVNKSGKLNTAHGITPQGIYNILRKRSLQAGVSKFSPHDLRRTFVSDLLDKGADLAAVSKLAGHSNPQTTARYDRRPQETMKDAAKLLHITE